MARSRVRENRWFKYMNRLRRHMLSCRQCKGAVVSITVSRMCTAGAALVVSAAQEFDAILELKRMAHKDLNGAVYACPDTAAHGAAYALSAEPLTVQGYQEGLF